MKQIQARLMAFFLCLALLFSLAGCHSESPTPSTGTQSTVPQNGCTHVDANDDGNCDKCSVSVLVALDFFAINDIHGKFKDSTSQPGVDELTSYLKAQGDDAILLSSGDSWQGSSESNLTQGALMTEWMNELNFVSMTLGNHEFDWGEEFIEANAELAEFPLLAINIYDQETNARVPYCQPSVMIERSGVTIGIIGAIGDCYTSISGDKTEGIYFLTGNDLTRLVMEESDRLRKAGADIIVYSIHDGYDKNITSHAPVAGSQLKGYYDVSLSDGYVDLVFEGHIHKRYVFTDEYGVFHLQAGGENTGISYAQLTYNTANQNISTIAKIIFKEEYSQHPSDSLIQDLLDKYADQIALGDQTVGQVGQYLSSDQIIGLVAQLYYQAGVERWGEEYDIALAGGLISVRNPYHIPAGEVKYSQLQSVLPFDNTLVLCSVQGSTLRDRFFETDDERYGIYYEAYGEALRDNIIPTETYYIITDTYTSSYKPNRLTVVAEYDAGVYARDLLADYIAEGKLAPATELTSIPDILAIGGKLSPNETTDQVYLVQGTVISIQNTTYGNLTIVDEHGNELFIYGVSDSTGTNRYDRMENPPQVGDTVILCGRIQYYVPQSGDPVIELVRTQLMSK